MFTCEENSFKQYIKFRFSFFFLFLFLLAIIGSEMIQVGLTHTRVENLSLLNEENVHFERALL